MQKKTYWNQAKFSYTTLGRILICPDVCPYVGQSLKWSYFSAVSRLFLNVNVLYVLEVLTHFMGIVNLIIKWGKTS